MACRTLCILAAAAMLAAWSPAARGQGRNCPSVVDQLVPVTPGTAAAFRLNVVNGEAGGISVFQYPLGGVLQSAGPTALDFVFIPTAGFAGTTTFTYRLTPPSECGGGAMLGRVTLVAGPAQGTASGLAVHDPARGLCGAGLLPLAMSCGMIASGGCRRRRGRKRGSPGLQPSR
jgi:hypothetical protein